MSIKKCFQDILDDGLKTLIDGQQIKVIRLRQDDRFYEDISKLIDMDCIYEGRRYKEVYEVIVREFKIDISYQGGKFSDKSWIDLMIAD